MSGHRLHPGVPGLQAGSAVDAVTGLPKELTLPDLEIHLLLIGGGDFDMGSESRPDTKPVHTVHVDAFYLSPTELTQRQWTALMGKNPSAKQGADLPVEEVSWMEAQGMLAVLNQRVPGHGFRLPTEAEWEYAAHTPGLKNIADSVSEWCSSLWRPYPYHADDGREDLQAEGLRVVRGGNFAEPGEWWSAAARHAARPDQRLETIGIRLAYSVP
jgi:formylglycine-generating enzyme required for sulfatase activity